MKNNESGFVFHHGYIIISSEKRADGLKNPEIRRFFCMVVISADNISSLKYGADYDCIRMVR